MSKKGIGGIFIKVALVGAELEENLGLRYMASALEENGHQVKIVNFDSANDIKNTIKEIMNFAPSIVGLSMVFTNRAREFCDLAKNLRKEGYNGHLIAGGNFASFNCANLLQDYDVFDSIALTEGEALICELANNLDEYRQIGGLGFRKSDGTVVINPSTCKNNLDELAFPKRTKFHKYFDKPIASILGSRGCWRQCAFCSINAWYDRIGGKKFRIRTVKNIIAEMKELYYKHGIRIFNFQDDNFFLPNPQQSLNRFEELRNGLAREGIEDIAIAIKARPDSITKDTVKVLDDLGLFRVFLGVENASENGLQHLNRKQTLDNILDALQILNDFDVHLAYNLLMFEPETVLSDILINLRFIERHIENPFNFCRAEAHAGTGLEKKLRQENRLIGNYFGLDYRLKDPQSEIFHQIANYAFFDRNFSDFGLHYFNMQIDFFFQLLRRFYPQILNKTFRGVVRNFIKETNMDTYLHLCQIYDFVESDSCEPKRVQSFARNLRKSVDQTGMELNVKGKRILNLMNEIYDNFKTDNVSILKVEKNNSLSLENNFEPYFGLDYLNSFDMSNSKDMPQQLTVTNLLGGGAEVIPYAQFKNLMSQQVAQYEKKGVKK